MLLRILIFNNRAELTEKSRVESKKSETGHGNDAIRTDGIFEGSVSKKDERPSGDVSRLIASATPSSPTSTLCQLCFIFNPGRFSKQ